MAIFNSYVSLPEGTTNEFRDFQWISIFHRLRRCFGQGVQDFQQAVVGQASRNHGDLLGSVETNQPKPQFWGSNGVIILGPFWSKPWHTPTIGFPCTFSLHHPRREPLQWAMIIPMNKPINMKRYQYHMDSQWFSIAINKILISIFIPHGFETCFCLCLSACPCLVGVGEVAATSAEWCARRRADRKPSESHRKQGEKDDESVNL